MRSFPSPIGFPKRCLELLQFRRSSDCPCSGLSRSFIKEDHRVTCFFFPILSSCIIQLPCYVCSFVCKRRLPSKCARAYSLCLIKIVVLIPFFFFLFFFPPVGCFIIRLYVIFAVVELQSHVACFYASSSLLYL